MKIHMISLGCDKNRVDSEKMLSNLLEKYPGSELTDDPAEADITVINTCAFIGDAKEESINTIIENGEYKETGRLKKLIVAGCLAERYREEIRKELPEVDEVIGVKEYIERLDVQMKRVENAENYTAYLKIAEGCDKCCTYCIIPKLRGHYRSVPMEHLLEEAKRLAAEGTKELILVAQETTLYGVDLYGKKSLPELLNRLSEIEGLEWIRILYCYPEEITEELIRTIRDNPKVVHYLDIPIQHASDKILKNMHRRTREAELRERIATLRREIPDIALRTTLITGFPGETEEDFQQTLALVREVEYDSMFTFLYSRRPGTAAAALPANADRAELQDRFDRLTALANEISARKHRACEGQRFRVLIDGCGGSGDYPLTGRTPGGRLVHLRGGASLTGRFADVRITSSNTYSLFGDIL